MPKFTFILILIISSISFAGGHGGGVMSAMAEKHMVYFQGEVDGLVKFSSATLDQNKWIIQNHSISTEELESNDEALAAIELSKQNNSWTKIER